MTELLTSTTINESFKSLANAMPQLVWMANAKGEVFYFNDRIAEFKGAERLPNGGWKWQGLLHPEDLQRTAKAWARAVASGTIYEIEHRVMMRDGNYRWLLSRAFPQKTETGKVKRWFGTATDIDEQKRNEQLLRLSESSFRAMFETSTVGMAQANAEGRLLNVNSAFSELLGYSKEELLLMRFSDFTHPQDRDADYERFYNMVTGVSREYVSEKRYFTKDGRIVWVVVTANPITDEQGRFRHTIAIIQDITDRKRMEDEAIRTATNLQIATESARAGTWYYNAITGKLEWSDLHKSLWGYDVSRADLVYDDWFGIIHPDDQAHVAHQMEQAAEFGEPYEAIYRIIRADGSMLWIHSLGKYFFDDHNRSVSATGISIDITDEKKREKELIHIKEQLELTVRNVPAGILLLNREGTLLYANEKAAQISSFNSAKEMMEAGGLSDIRKRSMERFEVRDRIGKLMRPEDSPVNRAFQSGQAVESDYSVHYLDTGKIRWIKYTANPLLDDEGQVELVLATSTDITDMKQAEQLIRQSEQQLRLLAESIPQMVWMADREGNWEYATGRWQEYSGMDPRDRGTWVQILHPDDVHWVQTKWQDHLAKGTVYHDEVRLRNRAGEYRWHRMTVDPVHDENGNIIKWIGVLTDIDEQKTSAERLEKLVAQRTRELKRSNEDLQQFAHVASHDLKEPLRKIRIFGSRIISEFGDELPPKALDYLAKMGAASDRLFTMIDGVLQYSSLTAEKQSTEPVDLEMMVESIKSDLEIIVDKKGAEIMVEGLPVIDGAPVLMHQLFYNLINNSLKFSKEDVPPRISIRGEEVEAGQHRYVKITLADNGIGFEQEYAEKIFNSFSRLNSKDRYEGTGLGLALCKKIVERHHGQISAGESLVQERSLRSCCQ